MTRAALALLAGVAGLMATRALLRSLVPQAPLRRPNYRGVPVASGMGVALLTGILAGAAVSGLLYSLRPTSRLLGSSAGTAVPLLALALGFGLLGLHDDVGFDRERGFAAHLRALRHGRLTGGALKLLAGAALAVTVVAPSSTTTGWALANGAIVALFANLLNGLDLRPGRAVKAFLVAAVPLAVAVPAASAILAAAIGAAVAFLPDDLRERAMLGDAGANALGALAGGATVLAAPPAWASLSLLGGLALLAVVADRPGLGRVIGAIPPLRALDRAGRIPEDAP